MPRLEWPLGRFRAKALSDWTRTFPGQAVKAHCLHGLLMEFQKAPHLGHKAVSPGLESRNNVFERETRNKIRISSKQVCWDPPLESQVLR